MEENSKEKEESKDESHKEIKIELPKKKYLDLKTYYKEVLPIRILTNLTELELDPKAIKGVYLYGCDIEEENHISAEFNPVNVMRKARKMKCFQDHIKKYVPDYYISGLILMGRPLKDKKKFKFYLKMGENNEILRELPEDYENGNDIIYKFKFKRKEDDLATMKEKKGGEAECVANYLNICLGKILKKCGYTKDRSTRKILYYNKKEVTNAQYLGQSEFLFFPALKAVCETYDEGKIYMKLLPKRLLKSIETYEEYFNRIESPSIEEALKIFKEKVVNRRGIKSYDQAIIKIEDVVYENPYKIQFKDRSNKVWTVGDYYYDHLKIKLENEKIPIAVRIIDKNKKLKGDDRLFIHIPCRFLEIIGNIFDKPIDIKKLVQQPWEKFEEIQLVRGLIEQSAYNAEEEELHNYLGSKFEPLTVDGNIIKPPLILFDKDYSPEVVNGSFNLIGTSPHSKMKELNKIDIYLLDLDNQAGSKIWNKLELASQDLGITFRQSPSFYPIPGYKDPKEFEEAMIEYFNKVDSYYNDKEKNPTDFIFMFMDSKKKNSFYYRIFKHVMNKYNWAIPTQVILYDERKLNKGNLSQFTNILCQMWAKKGNELYICDFSFVPKTMVVAYSSTELQGNKVLTSFAVSFGTKLYEYVFYSDITENPNKNKKISPSIKSSLSKVLVSVAKHLKKNIENIVIYRDAVNDKQIKYVQQIEIGFIQEAIENANKELEKKIFNETKWCLILVSKLNEVKMFLEKDEGGPNGGHIENVPVGTLVDRVITSNDKYDFYLNSAESRQGTCSSTHYTVLYDNTEIEAFSIYKLTYYLTFLSYNTTKSVRVPAPLYFVTRRNKFTVENLRGDIINKKCRTLNISL